MTRIRRIFLTAGICVVPAIAGAALLTRSGATQDLRPTRGGGGQQDPVDLFRDVLRRVATFAIDSAPAESLYVKAARGLIDQLDDPYAALYSPAEIARFTREQIGNAYGGLGVLIEDQRDAVIISRVYPNTPAEAAGLQSGDRIVEINGENARDFRVDQVSSRVLGVPGTEVQVGVARLGVSEVIRVKAKRAMVHVPSVPYALMLEGNVGYVPLQRFSESAAAEVDSALRRLKAQGARSYIFDLRENGGGDLDISIEVSGLFLKPGLPVVSVAHRGRPVQVSRSEGPPVIGDAPLVVLVDGYTASASEIVAGALQDHDRAAVVGTTSYGKGVVQTVYPLDGGWAMKLTTGKWLTPSGRSIQRPHPKPGDVVAAAAAGVPDSLETDSVRKNRPAFRSDAGRIVYGGGGITPDVIVATDTLSTIEQDFVKALGAQAATFRVAISRYTVELRGQVRPNFAVEQGWRDELYRRLQTAGVKVDRAKYDAAAPLVSRLIERQLAALAFGDSTAFRREIPRDPQLQRALDLLRRNPTQAQLLAAATARTGGSDR